MAPEENFKLIKYEYIIYSFEARDLEISNIQLLLQISKFRDFMNTLRNFGKSVFAHISAKLKYFAKQFILTESPNHVLQNDMQYVHNLKV